MHTDEYEISLSREIDVCRGRIRTIRKDLRKMEQKYGITTDSFAIGMPGGKVTAADGKRWAEDIELLRTWEDKQREFVALYNSMKK